MYQSALYIVVCQPCCTFYIVAVGTINIMLLSELLIKSDEIEYDYWISLIVLKKLNMILLIFNNPYPPHPIHQS